MRASLLASAIASTLWCNRFLADSIHALSPCRSVPAGIIVPAFPQRSPPRLLTAAACGGLRSAPDCRTRRALLHLSYSCAPPVLTAALVTHDPQRKLNSA